MNLVLIFLMSTGKIVFNLTTQEEWFYIIISILLDFIFYIVKKK